VANTFIKAEQIVEAAGLLLQREIVLPRLVWTQSSADFIGAKDDTINLRVPAVVTAKTRALRSTDGLDADDLTETSVPVPLDTHVYSLLNITDEQLTLDIRDFARQVLAPQMRAVGEGMEDAIATAIAGATWDATAVEFVEGTDDPYDVAVDARKALNVLNVPRSGRVLLLGSDLEAAFLKSDKLSKVNESGSDDALRDAVITRVAGFTVVGSNAIEPDEGYAFHSTAIGFGVVAPQVPAGAAQGARGVVEGLALRYLRDYNPTNSTGPVDRSLVDAFVGAASVEDGEAGLETNKRGVAINFTPDEG
jgi:hypothetical protein